MDGYSERQEDEVDFLQAVFPAEEFSDLRLKDPWKVTRKKERERERERERGGIRWEKDGENV